MNLEQYLEALCAEQRRTNQLLEQLIGSRPTLVSLSEAAKQLGVSLISLRRRVASREWPSYRIGRAIRVNLDEITPLVCVEQREQRAPIVQLAHRRPRASQIPPP